MAVRPYLSRSEVWLASGNFRVAFELPLDFHPSAFIKWYPGHMAKGLFKELTSFTRLDYVKVCVTNNDVVQSGEWCQSWGVGVIQRNTYLPTKFFIRGEVYDCSLIPVLHTFQIGNFVLHTRYLGRAILMSYIFSIKFHKPLTPNFQTFQSGTYFGKIHHCSLANIPFWMQHMFTHTMY